MFGKVKKFFSKVSSGIKKTAVTCCVLAATVMLASTASAEVTLPATGVDIGEYITAGITALGGVVAVAIGGYIAFLLVGRGLAWAKTAFRGK